MIQISGWTYWRRGIKEDKGRRSKGEGRESRSSMLEGRRKKEELSLLPIISSYYSFFSSTSFNFLHLVTSIFIFIQISLITQIEQITLLYNARMAQIVFDCADCIFHMRR